MKYEIKKLADSTVKLTIEVSQDEILRHKKKACENFSNDLKIPGFRPGHAPMHVVEQYIDKHHILSHTYELAVQYSYAEAVIKEKLQVVSSPKIKFISDTTKDFTDEKDESMKNETFKFEAEVAVMPEVKIKDYKSIKVPKEEPKVEKEEIDDTVNEMQKYFTTWTDVKDAGRGVKKDDRVEIDFAGFEPGNADAKDTKDKDAKPEPKEIPNTSSKNHPVIVGENTLIAGFEDNLIGMKKGEKKEFELTFPASYHKKDFQNKKVLFKVELHRLEEGVKPEVNEEFVEKVTGKKMTVEEFKKDIEGNISKHKEEEGKQKRENTFLEELLKRTEVDLPQALIDEEIDYIIEEVKHDMSHRKIEFDKFLEQSKLTLEDLRKKYKPEAEKRIRLRLAITKVIQEEKIEITDKELNVEIEKLVNLYPKENQKKIKEELGSREEQNRMRNKLLLGKFFEKILG